MKAMVVGAAHGSEGYRNRLVAFLERLGARLGRSACSLSVMLTDDEGIARYNEQFRGRPEPTDVLSFPSEAGSEGDSGHYLGDLIVSLDRAEAQAAEHGHETLEELEVLVLHGVLHLLGQDHEADEGQMRRLEAELARELFGGLRGLTERAEGEDA